MNEEFKLIFSPQLAKYLLSKGFLIVDLKQKQESHKETIFVFKNSDALLFEVNNWMSKK
jgi:hypothetical protein